MDRSYTNRVAGIRRKRIRQSASEALFYRSNWIQALLTSFLVIFFCGGILFLASSAFTFFAHTLSYFSFPTAVSTVCVILFSCIIVLSLTPLLFGGLTFFYDLYLAYQNDSPTTPPIAVIFSGYASIQTMLRAISGAFLLLSLLLIFVLVGCFTYFSYDLLCELSSHFQVSLLTKPVLLVIIVMLTLLLFFCALIPLIRFSPAAYLLIKYPGRSIPQCFKAALAATKGQVKDAVIGFLSFLLLLIPSILSVGVFFFIYVLPHTLFLYLSFCYTLTEE